MSIQEDKVKDLKNKAKKVKILTKKEMMQILSGIASGKIKDYTGLEPKLDVRIKAIEKLNDIKGDTREDPIKHITFNVVKEEDEARIKRIEEEIKAQAPELNGGGSL